MLKAHIAAISIHAPREGCDLAKQLQNTKYGISIHAPREGCDDPVADVLYTLEISIHAPREGCDRGRAGTLAGAGDFNPRTP